MEKIASCLGLRWRPLATAPWLLLAVVVGMAAPASARHNFSMLKVNPELGMAGGEVSVSGFSYPMNAKVSIRFNAVDGPVLAELDPTANQDISGTVRIPSGAPPGRYVLYAVQYDAAGKPNRIPGRGALLVAGPGAPPPNAETGLELESRPNSLVRSAGASAGGLVLAGLGAFALAGVIGLLMARVAVARKAGTSEERVR